MEKEHAVQTISVNELKKQYDNNDQICLIDVRELEEWQDIHIPKALHISKDNLLSQISDKIPEISLPIYLHCRSGVRSLHAANALLQLGYKDVYSVDGGIVAWAAAGYPTKTRIDESH
ncbi:MAG: rhodanese-like domain-containing protein [Legionellaceae bacterium]|nr:rhodanese-like domain-containing protein [Legionellaceae bacterium]